MPLLRIYRIFSPVLLHLSHILKYFEQSLQWRPGNNEWIVSLTSVVGLTKNSGRFLSPPSFFPGFLPKNLKVYFQIDILAVRLGTVLDILSPGTRSDPHLYMRSSSVLTVCVTPETTAVRIAEVADSFQLAVQTHDVLEKF